MRLLAYTNDHQAVVAHDDGGLYHYRFGDIDTYELVEGLDDATSAAAEGSEWKVVNSDASTIDLIKSFVLNPVFAAVTP